MPVNLPIRCNHTRNKTQSFQIKQINCIHISLQKIIQNLIISRQHCQHSPSVDFAYLHLFMMIFHPAYVATEFLIRSAVTYLISTLQTCGHLSVCNFIFHHVSFYQANIPRQSEKSNTPKTIFLFLNTIFLFFIIAAASKKNLVIIKKRYKCTKKRKKYLSQRQNRILFQMIYLTLPPTCKARIRCREEKTSN